jgi:ketosteroid isomerase-like protein
MSIEDNKAIVRRALQHLSDRNLPALFDAIHDEGSWSVPFRSDRFAFGGFKDKAGVCDLLTHFLGGFSSFSMTIQNLTAEDDRVVCEAVSEGVGPGTAQYKNNYILIFFIKDAKLHTVREYFDPFNVLAYVEQIPAG